MPKVKVIKVISKEGYYPDSDDVNYKNVFSEGIHDWEEITKEELLLLTDNIRQLYKFGYQEQPVILVQEEEKVKEKLKNIKQKLKEIEIKKAQQKKKQEEKKRLQKLKEEKEKEEQERQLFNDLKQKYEGK